MKQILITGGPVFAYLDDVKIITNRFKGGLMAKLAGEFVDMAENLHADKKVNRGDKEADVHVTYLCSKSSQQPWWSDFLGGEDTDHLTCVHHDGIDDYIDKVSKLAPDMDAIVLGAAVANLIPKKKIEGKFPSHDYKPGDTIPIEFTIAPRVIDYVKKINPKCHLFGFKLLSGADYYELIRAAYGVLLESKAVTVFANDAMDLMHKYAVTKERSVHPIHNNDVAQWILDRMDEEYYSTIISEDPKLNAEMLRSKVYLNKLLCSHKCNFIETDEGYIFGSGAVKCEGDNENSSFVTTARGKNELEDYAYVKLVDHKNRKVYCATERKASLNAPLFDYIFSHFPYVKQILHFHHQREDLITVDYATPGTDMDSNRRDLKGPSFNIEGHGCILSYNKIGKLIK